MIGWIENDHRDSPLVRFAVFGVQEGVIIRSGSTIQRGPVPDRIFRLSDWPLRHMHPVANLMAFGAAEIGRLICGTAKKKFGDGLEP